MSDPIPFPTPRGGPGHLTVAQGEDRDVRMEVRVSRWVCIASDHDGVPQPEDVGQRKETFELQVPRGYPPFDPVADARAKQLADAIVASIDGASVGTLAGGPYGNAYLIRWERPLPPAGAPAA